MPKIYVYPKKGDDFHIKLGDTQVSLGRSADNDIPLPDPFCPAIRRHAAREVPIVLGSDQDAEAQAFLVRDEIVQLRRLRRIRDVVGRDNDIVVRWTQGTHSGRRRIPGPRFIIIR